MKHQWINDNNETVYPEDGELENLRFQENSSVRLIAEYKGKTIYFYGATEAQCLEIIENNEDAIDTLPPQGEPKP